MKPIIKFKSSLIAIAGLSFFSLNVYAGCNRDDVEFYLSNNFTPEQITEICKTSSESNSSKSDPSINSKSLQVEKPLNDSQDFFKEAIDAYKVSISDEFISYTLKYCVEYAEEDNYGFAPKACPDIRYKISLSGLDATESNKTLLFFGERGINVQGLIDRKVMGGLDKRTEDEKQIILKKLESGDKTTIPVKKDVSVTEAVQAIKNLIK